MQIKLLKCVANIELLLVGETWEQNNPNNITKCNIKKSQLALAEQLISALAAKMP